MALAVLFGLVYLVVALNRRVDRAPAEAAVETEDVDPFADWPDEERTARSAEPDTSKVEGLDPDLWDKAVEVAEEAEALIESAVEALRAGDRATAREQGKAAQSLLDKALEASLVWEEALVEAYGEDASSVRRVRKKRDHWRRTVMALKKNANL